MAKFIGVVSKVVGEVFAVGGDGARRLVVEGDRLFAGEQLQTGSAGAVAVRLNNGAELTLGRDSSLQMSADLLANRAPHVHSADAPPSDAQLADVARLQQAIAAGADPSQQGEAPAAGPNGSAAPGALGGGHSFVMLEEVAARVDPQIGFPTAGFNGIPELANRYVGDLDIDNNNDNGDVPRAPVDRIDNPVSLQGLDLSPSELALDEANLALGSNSNPAALTQQGSFTVVAADGVFNLSVGGINVVTAGIVTGVGQSVSTPLGNTLTITGYNPSTGVVSYSYTLTGAEQHATGDGSNTVNEHLPVWVSDSDGDVATGSLDVIIHDDVPQAVDDSNPVSASEQQLELTGNVLNNDQQGADRVPGGPVIAGTFTGTYGTLVLATDGSYTYTLNPDDPDFKGLKGGDSNVETFSYTIRDADGDSSSAVLTLNISNLDDPVTLGGVGINGDGLNVYERNLSDGSAPNAGALTQSSAFTVTAADGLQNLTVGGITVISGGVVVGVGQSVTTPLGNTLTITGYNPSSGVVSYSYTLLDNEAHPNADGSNTLQEQFSVIAEDRDGSSASSNLLVNIIDDVPQAEHDSNPIVATEQHLELSGNVLSNDQQGADRVTGGPVIAGTFAGTYGTLVLAANGAYTYTLNPDDANFKALKGGGDGVETFTYTITDADGDTSSATLTLNISNLDDPVTLGGLDASGGELTVYEKHLSDGSAPNPGALSPSGTFTVTAADGLQTLTVAGITLVSGGVAQAFPQSVTTALGTTLTITGYEPSTGVVSYSYSLLDNEAHATADGVNNLQESFTVTAQDSDGSTATGTLDVTIVDDVPRAHCDFASVTEGGQVSGNLLWNDIIGADTVSDGQYVIGVRAGSDTSTPAVGQLGVIVQGTYGYVVLDAEGNGTYQSYPNSVPPAGATDTFVYTIRDADGDLSTTTVTISVHDNSLLASEDTDVTVYEKALDLIKDGNDLAPGTVVGSQPGSTAETATGTLVGSVSGGVGALTYSLVGDAVGQYGQIQVNADGSYSYTLTSAPNSPVHQNDGPNITTESFTYQATDSLGNSTTSTIVISIVDDVPQARCDSAAVLEGCQVSGNLLWNDVVGADVLSDGKYVVGVRAGSDTATPAHGQLGVIVQGTYGYVILDAEGNGTYQSYPNSVCPAGATDTFVYTLRDADGDESTTTVTIHIQDSQLVASQDSDITVYEQALDLIGSQPGSPAETATGSLVGAVTGGYGAFSYSLVGDAVGQYGQIQVNADGSYSYTLTSAPNSPVHQNDGPNITTETFTYQATDSLGNSTTSTIVINIVDDVPQAHCDSSSVLEGGQVSGNLLWNDVVGADVLSDGKYVVGVRAGNDTSTPAHGQLGMIVQGAYGYVILDAEGNGTYQSYPDSVCPAGATDTFVYTIRDADGDESTTTVTIHVRDNQLVASQDSDVTVYEQALDLIGSQPCSTAETATGTLVGAVSGGYGALTYSLVGDPVGQHGQIQVNADGSYSYTLTSAPNSAVHQNDGANITTETFTYQATDSLGNSTTSTIVISIVDDVPQAHCDASSVLEGCQVSGNLLSNDVFGADVLSDGKYVVGVRAGNDTSTPAHGQLGVIVQGTYGHVIVDAEGNGTYQSYPDSVCPAGATDTFVYTIRDADGDESTTTVTLYIQDRQMVASQRVALDSSAFVANASSMSAALLVAGLLGQVSSDANGQDLISVTSSKGETLKLDHDRPEGNLMTEWKDAAGSYPPISDGGSSTVSHDGLSSVPLVNMPNDVDNAKAEESHKLSRVINSANSENQDYPSSYTLSDSHGGAVGSTDHAGSTLGGTSVDDVLLAGAGNDTLDGGDGIDTASYASASAAVTVDLSVTGQQATGGGGLDTLVSIENLIGSDFDDRLTGNGADNQLDGGHGNDVLAGGGGSDTFVWHNGDSGHDTVSDFTPGSDRLDLSQLLQGENASAGSLDDYLHFKVAASGGNVVSTIEVSSVAGAAPTQSIDLAGVDLAQHYGVTAGAGGMIASGHDTATIINGMLNDHSLKVDTV
ncbi:retention module-containing protein [Pseudomonas sp. BP8]|uniref:retention module-containing protein n=1 Tax=Pseudomonas sp. BP8 TaxID=2817864 RepID=UPI001AE4492F|nr:retention module-containing protein [Pseudomonas sp. BP8]MBP2261064.1 VCBS repeat-containing protein [Pseudomonas sp. BP8]HDS1735727.1 retention module-containing protein [Pseudomonas putida]